MPQCTAGRLWAAHRWRPSGSPPREQPSECASRVAYRTVSTFIYLNVDRPTFKALLKLQVQTPTSQKSRLSQRPLLKVPTSKMRRLWFAAALASSAGTGNNVGISQIELPIPLVDRMPSAPQPWIPVDWLSLARNQTGLVFNLTSSIQYTPLLWWDDAEQNFPQRTFGVPSYVGQTTSGQGHEEIAGGAVNLNAALASICGQGTLTNSYSYQPGWYFLAGYPVSIWRASRVADSAASILSRCCLM